MKKNPSIPELEATAHWTSYLALSGIWFILSMLYVAIAIKRGTVGDGILVGMVFPFSVGFLFAAWLHGFSIKVKDGVLFYRNGIYQKHRLCLNDIIEIRSGWVEWKNFGKRVQVPRLVIEHTGGTLLINAKPFSRGTVQAIMSIIEK